MTTAASTNGWAPEGAGTQLPPGDNLPLAASQQAGLGQILMYDASGNVILADGTDPGLYAAGRAYPEKLSGTSTTAAAAALLAWTGYGSGDPASTIASDGFSKIDVCTPAFVADGNMLGKKSNDSGSNRGLAGLVLGVDVNGNPRSYVGPIAQAIARGVLIADRFMLASTEIADAAANTAISEKAILRPRVKGTVTSISLTGAAIVADNTDYITVTVSKRDGAGGGAVVLGTYDSRAANNGAVTAFVPAEFTLSVVAGALYLLETDIVTITTVKGGSGKVITGQVLVNGKAI